MDQTCSDLIKLDQTCPKWIKIVLIGSNFKNLLVWLCSTVPFKMFCPAAWTEMFFSLVPTQYHSVSDPLGKSDPNFEFFGLSMAALVHLYTFSMLKVILPHLCTKKGHKRS